MLRYLIAGSLALASLFAENAIIERGTLALSASARLQISTEGALTVRGHSGLDQVRYTVRRMGAPSAGSNVILRASGNADPATLTVVGSDRRLPGFELSVDVPDWLVQILMETRTGDILASDLKGKILVRTGAGRIELDRLGSDLELRSGGGEIRLGRVSGSVRCFSSVGGIRAESVGRESWFQTGGGDLVVLESGGKLHLSTGGGNIQVDRSAGEVFASTRGGAIKLGQINGMVTAETDGGRVQVDSASGLRCLSAAGHGPASERDR